MTGEAKQTNVQANLWPDNNSTDAGVVASSYDKAAETYDDNALEDGWNATFQAAAPWIDMGLKEGAKIILDAGCATGLLPKKHAFPEGVVFHGFDISADCLDKAKQGGQYISLKEANINEALPYASDEFDLIFCNGVLGYCDTNGPLAELLRVLKPGCLLLMEFRRNHFLERGYDKALEDEKTGCEVVHQHTFDPYPSNPAYKHEYLLTVVRKSVISDANNQAKKAKM